ncbi:MAG TPA: tetratricopeptide repeat protein [Oculatellaceae cyanobacterium]|jgi:tetratricopeptide (TPR) repeat protein
MRLIRVFLTLALAVSLQPVAFAHGGIAGGVTLYQNRQYQSAKGQFLRLVAADPTNAAAQYYLANTYVKLGQHSLAQKHYKLASLLNPGGPYGAYAVTALKAYGIESGDGRTELQSNMNEPSDQNLLPESHFAVARITGQADWTDNERTSQYKIPQQYPQVAGYDAERSYLYQHGLWQAYGGPINTELPPHTTTHDARDYGLNHHHDPIIVRRSY